MLSVDAPKVQCSYEKATKTSKLRGRLLQFFAAF